MKVYVLFPFDKLKRQICMKDEVIKKMTNVNDIELEKIKRELKNSR